MTLCMLLRVGVTCVLHIWTLCAHQTQPWLRKSALLKSLALMNATAQLDPASTVAADSASSQRYFVAAGVPACRVCYLTRMRRLTQRTLTQRGLQRQSYCCSLAAVDA